MMHRDSTGVVQRIEPGAVNWMTAGRGIVHSERRPKDLAARSYRNHGLQLWVGLPEADEESAPSFQHATAESIPELRLDGRDGAHRRRLGVRRRLADRNAVADARPGVRLRCRERPVDRAARARLGARALPDRPPARDRRREGRRVHDGGAARRRDAQAVAPRGGRVALVGGEPLGHRFMSWNFVSSSRERILAAEADWEAQRFDRIPGETEFIPLPARHSS
jgi:redox-sensitive bicupin YhaK (pirin superfamily)